MVTLFPLLRFIPFVCSDTGTPRRLFRHADERNYDRGEAEAATDRHIEGTRVRVKRFFLPPDRIPLIRMPE